jgi:hypothetical protein
MLNKIAFGLLVGLTSVAPTWAVPMLQLDASPSIYLAGEETVQATANPFTLYALGDTSSSKFSLSSYYYVAVAVINKSGAPMTFGSLSSSSLGSFKIDSTTYHLSDLFFGTPPIENALLQQPKDAGDLPTHGVFPTYFTELKFKFNTANTAISYNTADHPGGPTAGAGSLLYEDFNVDVSGLGDDYLLHFDLYNEALKNGDTDVDNFAPFSHDAVSGGSTTNVPDASTTVALLGLSLLGMAGFRQRFASK